MLEAIIIDDDPAVHSFINKELKPSKDIIILGSAGSVKEGLNLIQSTQPDVLFLDLDLPDGKGFDLIDDQLSAEVIFITAHDEYAAKAFDYAAIDYLLKPIDPDRLHESINRVLKLKNSGNWQGRYQILKNNQLSDLQDQRLVLRMSDGYEVITISEIVHCTSSGNYTEIHTISGAKFLSSKTLKEFDMMLSPLGFFRCHQSHLINRSAIKGYRNFKSEIKLTTGHLVKLARSKTKEFVELMESHRFL